MSSWVRRFYILFEPAPAGWWKFWRMFRRRVKPEKLVPTTLEQHNEGLAGKVSMWTYDGVNYWWLDGHLWACRDRTDEERGISRTWTDEEKRQVLSHAKDAVALLTNHPDANDYIKTVLIQSHGKTDGIGFEDNPGEDLHPLSKVFIVADAFVKVLLNPNMPSSKKDILPILSSRYLNPSYQKIIKALEQKFQ